MPALGGEATLFAAGGFEPRFSPDGRWISYHTGIKGDDDGAGRLRFASAKLFIVPSAGGEARQIQPTAKTATAAAWSPDSRHLLIVGSFETSNIKTSDDTGDWWVTPLEGAATRVERDSLEQREPFVRVGAPVAWLPGNRIVFPATSRDSRNQWVVTLSNRDWQIDGVPVRLTSGAGIEGPAAVSIAVGVLRLAFSTVVNNVDLWSVPLSRDGMQTSSQPFHLTLDAARELHPTLAFDGRTLIYASDRRRRRELWVRDLVTGREALLVSAPGNDLSKPVISRDGSKLAFRREQRRGQPAATSVADLSRAPDGSLRAGPPRQLPSVGKEGSGWAWSWSPSGELLWHDPAQWPTIAPNQLYDIARASVSSSSDIPRTISPISTFPLTEDGWPSRNGLMTATTAVCSSLGWTPPAGRCPRATGSRSRPETAATGGMGGRRPVTSCITNRTGTGGFASGPSDSNAKR
jgi:dipeptidyl aminopeptidase/acylaminoacyl peptidase